MLVVALKNFVLIMMITLIVHYTLDADPDAARRKHTLHKETLAFRERAESFATLPSAPADTVGMMAKSERASAPPKDARRVADETPAMRELYDFVFDDSVAETQLDAMFAPIEAPKAPAAPKADPKADSKADPKADPKAPAPKAESGKVMSGCAYEVIGALDAPKEGPAPMGTDTLFSGLI